jgi:hypothetical protein
MTLLKLLTNHAFFICVGIGWVLLMGYFVWELIHAEKMPDDYEEPKRYYNEGIIDEINKN